VRTSGAVGHAQQGVRVEVARAIELAERLPDGPARLALVQLARFLAVRCGAEAASDPLLGYGRPGGGSDTA